MQDFLLTQLLREAVTYKLAHQIHNMRPENDYALGPLDVFPADIAAAADWRNLLFSGWWSWLEKWDKLVSIFLGVYNLYVIGRWLTLLYFPSFLFLCLILQHVQNRVIRLVTGKYNRRKPLQSCCVFFEDTISLETTLLRIDFTR